jgi:programmed cell death protein 5
LSKENIDEKAAQEEVNKQRMMREGALRMLLSSEARERLTNVRMVKPDLAQSIEDSIIRLASEKRIKIPVEDEDVKKFLTSVQKPKREFKIRRI